MAVASVEALQTFAASTISLRLELVQQEQASAGFVFLPGESIDNKKRRHFAKMYLTKKTLNFLTSNRFIETVLGGHFELDDEVVTHGE